MNELSEDTAKHIAIAKRVHDKTGSFVDWNEGCKWKRFLGDSHQLFNMLESYSGEPTPQAKASAFDTLRMIGESKQLIWTGARHGYCSAHNAGSFLMKENNPCEAIFNAAWEIVNNE